MTKQDCKEFVESAMKFKELLDETIIRSCEHPKPTLFETSAYYPAVKVSNALQRLIDICKE